MARLLNWKRGIELEENLEGWEAFHGKAIASKDYRMDWEREREHAYLKEVLKWSEGKHRLFEWCCGRGGDALVVNHFKPDAWMSVLDYSPVAIEFAKARFRKEGLIANAVCGNVYDLPFPDGAFDFSFSQSSFSNLEKPDLALKELVRTLEKNGFLMLCAANSMRPDGSWLYRHAIKLGYFQTEYSIAELREFGVKHGLTPIGYFGYQNCYFLINQFLKKVGVKQEGRTKVLSKLNALPLPVGLKLFVGVVFRK